MPSGVPCACLLLLPVQSRSEMQNGWATFVCHESSAIEFSGILTAAAPWLSITKQSASYHNIPKVRQKPEIVVYQAISINLAKKVAIISVCGKFRQYGLWKVNLGIGPQTPQHHALAEAADRHRGGCNHRRKSAAGRHHSQASRRGEGPRA